MIRKLNTSYPSSFGNPVILFVDTKIFVKKYFTHCMQCDFCKEWCCSFGVEVDIENVRRIEAVADDLENYAGISKAKWFTGEYFEDQECPGGSFTRTQVVDDHCVFLSKNTRGCLLHSFSIERGIDYHGLKPMISCLFPLTYEDGVLLPADEVLEDELICLGRGRTLYEGVRNEILHYFGEDLVKELDGVGYTVLHDEARNLLA